MRASTSRGSSAPAFASPYRHAATRTIVGWRAPAGASATPRRHLSMYFSDLVALKLSPRARRARRGELGRRERRPRPLRIRQVRHRHLGVAGQQGQPASKHGSSTPSKIGARDVVRLHRHEHLQVDAGDALEPAHELGPHERPVEHEPQVAAQPVARARAWLLSCDTHRATRNGGGRCMRTAPPTSTGSVGSMPGLGRCSTSIIAQLRGTSTNRGLDAGAIP